MTHKCPMDSKSMFPVPCTCAPTWTFGGVHMTEREHAVMSAVVARGTCPYCKRPGLSPRYGSNRKHVSACGKRLTLLGKEIIFAEWMAEARQNGRHI